MPRKTALQLFEDDIRAAVNAYWAYTELNDGTEKGIEKIEKRVARRRKRLQAAITRGNTRYDDPFGF
jgi:ribosome-interacting GTPase 1